MRVLKVLYQSIASFPAVMMVCLVLLYEKDCLGRVDLEVCVKHIEGYSQLKKNIQIVYNIQNDLMPKVVEDLLAWLNHIL